MAVLDELADLYVPLALPWDDLERTGQGLVESDAYVNLLDARFDEYYKVLWSLDLPELRFESRLDSRDAIDAYDFVEQAAIVAAPPTIDAIRVGLGVVGLDEALRVRVDAVRRFLVLLNSIAYASFVAHENGVARGMVREGTLGLDEAKQDASDTYALMGAVIQLDALGVLGALKRPGLGAAPAGVLAAIVVGVAVAIAAIAWMVVTLVEGSRRVEWMMRSCFDEEGRPLAERPSFCDEYGKNIAEDPNAHLAPMLALSKAASTAVTTVGAGVATALVVGVVAWVGARWVLPALFERGVGGRGGPARGGAMTVRS